MNAATGLKADRYRVIPVYKTNASIAMEPGNETVVSEDRLEYINEDWDWYCMDEGCLKYRFQHDKSRLYVEVLVKDDKYELGGDIHDQQEFFFQKPGEKMRYPLPLQSLTFEDVVITIPGFNST